MAVNMTLSKQASQSAMCFKVRGKERARGGNYLRRARARDLCAQKVSGQDMLQTAAATCEWHAGCGCAMHTIEALILLDAQHNGAPPQAARLEELPRVLEGGLGTTPLPGRRERDA